MLHLSTPRERSWFSYSSPQVNPPIASVLEQCCWSEPTDQYFNVDKYNGRRYTQNICNHESNMKEFKLPKRPFVTPTTSPDFGVTGEKVTKSMRYHINYENEEDQSVTSRSSTPDYMTEVYDQYIGSSSKLRLLRRPLPSHYDDDDDISEVEDNVYTNSLDSYLIQNTNLKDETVQQNSVLFEDILRIVDECYSDEKLDASTTTDDSASAPHTCDSKTHVILDVDIPTCKNNDVVSEEDDANIKADENCTRVNISSTLTDEERKLLFQSKTEDLKLNRPKTSSKTKRKSKQGKKKAASKKKVDLSTINVNYKLGTTVEMQSTLQNKNRLHHVTWRGTDDDIVTQMSSLGLTKPLGDEDPVALLQPDNFVSPKASSASVVEEELTSPKRRSKNLSFSKKANESLMFEKRRRVPIQIICDPFKCNGNRSSSQTKQRPHTASPYLGRNQTSLRQWK